MKKDGKIKVILIILLALCFTAAGCNDAEEEDDSAYHYVFDEITYGYFGKLVPVMTLNEWCLNVLKPKESYDDWTQRENVLLYKDKKLTIPYAGSDLIGEDSDFYCDFSFMGLGKKVGQITGTITLTEIPDRNTKVFFVVDGKSGDSEWKLPGKVNLTNIAGRHASNCKISVPVYETFVPNTSSQILLYVLPGDSKYTYQVVFLRGCLIKDDYNLGKMDDRGIPGVNFSGTIDISYNGETVPYVEIQAIEIVYNIDGRIEVGSNTTILEHPSINAPWSVTLGTGNVNPRNVDLKITGYSKKNGTADDLLFTIPSAKTITFNVNNDTTDIALNIGDKN
ncbi:MAG: hypothetical protein FWB73_07935 [Treponema sp.]|nr:hypothetical protein [Treponema sp.]